MNRLAATAVILIFPFGAVTQEDDSRFVPQGYITGQRFLELQRNERLWAASGAIDGLLGATQFGAPLTRVMKLRNCLQDRNNGQVVAMIERFVRDRPEQWHVPFALLVSEAMATGCQYNPRE